VFLLQLEFAPPPLHGETGWVSQAEFHRGGSPLEVQSGSLKATAPMGMAGSYQSACPR